MSVRCGNSRGGRSRQACTSSFRAERRARVRRSGRRAGARRRASSSRQRTAVSRSSPAPAATTHEEVIASAPADEAQPARAASFRSRPTTTSRRQEGLYQHYSAIAGEQSGCRSSSTTCPAGPAATSRSATLVASELGPGHRRRQGSVGQHDADVRRLQRGAGRLHRALGRRCADAAADGGRRARDHFGRRRTRFPAEMARMVELRRAPTISTSARADHTRACMPAAAGELRRSRTRIR